MTLNDAPLNVSVTVTDLLQTGDGEITKLTAMGIIPGIRLQLIQKKPVPVFKIGFSRFAIDKKLASLINVEQSAD